MLVARDAGSERRKTQLQLLTPQCRMWRRTTILPSLATNKESGMLLNALKQIYKSEFITNQSLFTMIREVVDLRSKKEPSLEGALVCSHPPVLLFDWS